MTISPEFVIRLRKRSKNRSRTSGGRLGDVRTPKCSTALLETLLTFCPPGPLLRAKDNRNSASGMTRLDVMGRSMGSSGAFEAGMAMPATADKNYVQSTPYIVPSTIFHDR